MAATIIPLAALGIITAVLVMAWPRRRQSPAPAPAPVPPDPQPLTAEQRAILERHDRKIREIMLDSAPFGEALARRMWRRVMSSGIDEGIIPNRHKEYCGHGLVRTTTGVALREIEDGHAIGIPNIASWDDEESFVAFFARQSNHSVNGYDPAEPAFYTDNEWSRGNQRLTRQELARVLGGRA